MEMERMRPGTNSARAVNALFQPLGGFQNHFGQGKQGNGVGNDHQIVEHIRQFPNQIIGHQGAQEDEYQGNHHVNLDTLLSEQVIGVDLTKQVPAQNGRECEEEQTHGNEHGTGGLSINGTESSLCQVGFVQHGGDITHIAVGKRAVRGVKSGDDDQSVQGQNHKGVDEHTDHGHDTLLMGIGNIGLGVGVRSGAHTGFIGRTDPAWHPG